MITIDLIAAARPNFMKIAPLLKVLSKEAKWCKPRVIHTGQHYDDRMSEWFFRDLGIAPPYINLEVGSGTHAEQTGRVMVAYEAFCLRDRPDWTIVVGDVNSTLACALAARKIGIPVAHLEAGLRSGDREMPEEINRVATDAIADLLWTPSEDADANLRREGISETRICRVGNIMIDSYEMLRPIIESKAFRTSLGLSRKSYGVVTLHRPSNVDDPAQLRSLLDVLSLISQDINLVFPVHPRTRQRLHDLGQVTQANGLRLIDPVGYIDFMSLVNEAAFVVTDSGGIQEETTYLGIPCLTLRTTTERPITVTLGTNELVTHDNVAAAVRRILLGTWKKGSIPPLWDGKTAGRIIESLIVECGTIE
jgi:UDP-N-acetylglucosamine 2-epimerase (non-hydrolysing)